MKKEKLLMYHKMKLLHNTYVVNIVLERFLTYKSSKIKSGSVF